LNRLQKLSAQRESSKVKRKESQHKELFDMIGELVELQKRALLVYEPEVESILRTGSRDVRRIEQALDNLLNIANYDPALELFKQLCRHYLQIDPQATASFVYAYRDLWGDE
jgi:hypothetical protein